MKKHNLSMLFTVWSLLAMVVTSVAQNTFPDPGPGYAGVGISNPNADMQLHGTTDYFTGSPSLGRSLINHGKTSRVLLTNTVTGSLKTDGLLLRMSGNNAYIDNQENKDLNISSGSIGIKLIGTNNRIEVGSVNSGSTSYYGKFNLLASGDNGIYVKNVTSGKYGLRLYVRPNANAIEVVEGNAETDKTFTVTREGKVYARKYTTTLSNIPDYVFDESYELMTIDELNDFVTLNNHLPNVPSAKEYETNGLDLGEMNRILLEKVEELSLYIIQLNEEVKLLKENE